MALANLKNQRVQKGDYESRRTLEQLTSYARAAFSYQHRTNLFQLLILGDFVRFLRWDRAGAIVTDRINYIQDPEPLVRFFKSYSNMTDAQRGWDVSVVPPSSEEDLESFREAVNTLTANIRNPEHMRQFLSAVDKSLERNHPTYQDGDDDNFVTGGAIPVGFLFSKLESSFAGTSKRSITECIEGDDAQAQGPSKAMNMKVHESDPPR